MTHEQAVVDCDPRGTLIGRGHKAPRIRRPPCRVTVGGVASPKDLDALVEVIVAPWADTDRHMAMMLDPAVARA